MNLYYHINRLLLPQLTWRRATKDKVVYLTFDDGPHPEITPWVLDQLAKKNAKGTFFVVGENARDYPEMLDQIEKAGHSIGNHTMHHIKGWDVKDYAYLEDVAMCQTFLPEKRLFRPPHGRINIKSIPRLLSDYEIVMWDVLAKDWMRDLDVRRQLQKMKKNTTNGSILVFHDSAKAAKNLRLMLPEMLSYLSDNGFRLEAL